MRNYTRKFNFLSYSKFLLRKGSSLFCDHSKLEFLIFGLMCAAFLAWKREGGGGGRRDLLCVQLSYIRKSITFN